MKSVYYSIKYKLGSNIFQKMNEYLFAELAEKECQELNKTSKNTYFVELTTDEIQKAYNYKGFYVSKSEAGLFYIFKKEGGKRTYKAWRYSFKAAKEYINNFLLSEMLSSFIKGIRQYNNYSVSRLICEKTFNHGNGSLALFRILPEEKKIKVNSSLATKRDIQRINEFKTLFGLNYDLSFVSYSYPEYYNHSF